MRNVLDQAHYFPPPLPSPPALNHPNYPLGYWRSISSSGTCSLPLPCTIPGRPPNYRLSPRPTQHPHPHTSPTHKVDLSSRVEAWHSRKTRASMYQRGPRCIHASEAAGCTSAMRPGRGVRGSVRRVFVGVRACTHARACVRACTRVRVFSWLPAGMRDTMRCAGSGGQGNRCRHRARQPWRSWGWCSVKHCG